MRPEDPTEPTPRRDRGTGPTAGPTSWGVGEAVVALLTPIRERYLELRADEGELMVKDYRQAMDEGKQTVDPVISNYKNKFAVDWLPFLNRKWTDAADTSVPAAELKRLSERITTIPANVTPHQLVKKVYDDRAAMGRGEEIGRAHV